MVGRPLYFWRPSFWTSFLAAKLRSVAAGAPQVRSDEEVGRYQRGPFSFAQAQRGPCAASGVPSAAEGLRLCVVRKAGAASAGQGAACLFSSNLIRMPCAVCTILICHENMLVAELLRE